MDERTRRKRRTATDAARPPITLADLRIFDKQQHLVPLQLNRAQRHLLDHLTGRDLVLKARQLGISTAVQAWLFMTALNQTARIGTLAHDKDTTQKLRDMAQTFYDELSEDKQPRRIANTATRTQYADTKSIVYFGTAGNPRGGRGGTYSHVHGSEVAFWKDARRVLAGLLQGVPQEGSIILESTPNGAQGWFYEQVMRALEGNSVWAVHFFPWWWDEGYRVTSDELRVTSQLSDDERQLVEKYGLDAAQIAWRRQKQLELGELFAQEYPEDPYSAFLKGGDRYFRLHADMFSAPSALYMIGHRYVAGLDFGQAHDYTVCSVLDVTTREQVDLLRLRQRSWADIRRAIVELCLKWGISTLVAESNSMGGANIEALNGELGVAGCPTAIVPFQTTHSSKSSIIAELRLALEEGGLKLLLDPAQRHELEVFTSRQTATGAWQLTAPDGDHDDCVMALALAWHAAGSGSLVIFSA
jgi:hypothetical protein